MAQAPARVKLRTSGNLPQASDRRTSPVLIHVLIH
jgi:hypothetical protein